MHSASDFGYSIEGQLPAASPANAEPLTQDDYDRLTSGRNVIVRHKAASLMVRWAPVFRPHHLGDADHEARFVMEGPSGKHSLMVEATPLSRLNAHWLGFASHPANQAEA